MKDCPFIQRKIGEYESELGPKLILIAKTPLPTDKKEIFDSKSALSYLTEVFKTRFKSLETHITYVEDPDDKVTFAREMFFNILGHYVVKGTLDPTKLAIGFIGQDAFEAFKKDYLSQPDMGGISLYLNEDKQVIKPYAAWLNNLVKKEGNKARDVLLPYVILPDVSDNNLLEINSILENISFTVDLPDSPYCDTNQINTKLQFFIRWL